jgi:hypothetical protein
LTAVIPCFFTVSAQADLRILKRSPTLEVSISGTIVERDARAFEALSQELERTVPYVKLDSIGGDVDAAMRIGRLIRKYEGHTIIEREPAPGDVVGRDNANCYSSCALIFIAGVARFVNSSGGQLGLHRPYFVSAPQDRQVLEKKVPLMLSQIRQYITEMGITQNFYEQMVNTEPSQMVVYGNPNVELKDYNRAVGIRTVVGNWTKLVPAHDPVYEEIVTSYDARRYGVTTLEMRKRESEADACLKKHLNVRDWNACAQAARWGLSERVYGDRDKQALTCWHDEDTKFLQTIPTKERKDHPVWIKRETCVRNIMLGHT